MNDTKLTLRLQQLERRLRIQQRLTVGALAIVAIEEKMRATSHRETAKTVRSAMSAKAPLLAAACAAAIVSAQTPPQHPRLLFSAKDVPAFAERAKLPALQPVAQRLLQRADRLLTAPPIVPSITKRGEPDPPGEQKGIASARALQGRVITFAMAFTLTRDRKFRDAAVAELRRALDDWRIWVDTAHTPPYDLMTGENCLTFGLAYDWLYHDLTPAERTELRTGVERRGLQPFLDMWAKKAGFLTGRNNWNPVTNGGAAVAALAFESESAFSDRVLQLAVPGMDHYWQHLADDGGWDEGTGYWTYGHRYAFIAAEALRRSGKPGGDERFQLPGAKRTGYFPIVFNPGRTVTAGFGDSNSRVSDPILYLLGREYRNPDFLWFQDRARVPPPEREGWPSEALALVWRPAGEPWLPESQPAFTPTLSPTFVFPSIGWGLMAPRQPDPPFFLAFKNGSLGASHTHLDLNHISVGMGDTMMLVELGSRPYPADYFSAKRYSYYEIGTRGHNTVLIGGKGQARGKVGKLLGPIEGRNTTTLVGVADGAYEVETTRVRRHVALVDNSTWVILDEIVTPQPQTVELRFHTYGTSTQKAPGAWQIADGGRTLDVRVPDGAESSSETPDGWTRPVRVLSARTEPSTTHALVTVLQPSANAIGVRVARDGDRIVVTVGSTRVEWRQTPEGWQGQHQP